MRDALATHNERVKLLANLFHALALGIVGFAVLRPLTDDLAAGTAATVWWGTAGLALHASAHYVLRYLRKDAP